MPTNYSAIYYPDCYVDSPQALATYLLIYDELHLVALYDDASNPTDHLSKIPQYTHIKGIRKGRPLDFTVSSTKITCSRDPGEIDDQTRRMLSFYQFVQRYKPLIGNALFYHPHLLASAMNQITGKLVGGGLDINELAKFLSWEDEEMKALDDFQKEFPEIKDEVLWRIVPSALKLAKEKELILVSDKVDIPVPILSREISSVRNLTSILAEECVRITVPNCREVAPEEILEIRHDLKELLVPFRMSLQKLSKDLRSALDANADIEQIRQEAKFIAESKVEPAVFELKQMIEKNKSKLFNKVFGKVVSWIPFVAKAFAVPTPDNLLSAATKIGADTGALMDAADDVSYTRTQGLCFLLKVAEELGSRDTD